MTPPLVLLKNSKKPAWEVFFNFVAKMLQNYDFYRQTLLVTSQFGVAEYVGSIFKWPKRIVRAVVSF